MKRTLLSAAALAGLLAAAAQATFVHPGCLSAQEDLDRMAARVGANAQPWKGSWDILTGNTDGMLDDIPAPVSTVQVGGGLSENYMNLARDAAKAYQCALRYHGSGNTDFADKAVEILNAWASTHTGWDGDSNVDLRAGLYGYQLACAAELLRGYSGWPASDFNAFQGYMLNVFYPENSDFLSRRNGTYDLHYWANWTLSSAASMMAIGVLCDSQAIFDEGLNYLYHGAGTERMEHAVPVVHPNGLGQWQESGRDQGHTLMGPQLMGVICEIAWNQGIDLYGYLDNRFLAGVEYISKYNTARDVPFTTYVRPYGNMASAPVYHIMITNNPASRGAIRPGWDLVYNHYVNRMGMSAPFTRDYAAASRPEGGGFNYGSTSGGFDGLGFTTLTHSRDPIAEGALPSALRPVIEGPQVTLSWGGSAYATSYNVKRSAVSGGPYITLATVEAANLFYVDPGLTAGMTYYYVVSANNPGGEGDNSAEAAATPDGRLHGKIIGTEGSWNDAGATRETVFDGSLDNYFDPPAGGAWVGLDLGSNVSAAVTEVRYCPRDDAADRMVGGRFQGSGDGSTWTTLYTIGSAPPEGLLTSQAVLNTNAFRYVRYINTVNWNNVAEIEFHGSVSGLQAPAAPSALSLSVTNGAAHLSWSSHAAAESYTVKRAVAAAGPFMSIGNVADPEFVDTTVADGMIYYYVVSALNSAGESPDSEKVQGSLFIRLTGAVIGTSGSWGNNPETTRDAAMDGNTGTYFDADIESGAWVGLDLGEGRETQISSIRFYPRSGYASRMTGGKFQGSRSADFTAGVVDLYTIVSEPPDGVYSEQAISSTAAFRYVRYIKPVGGYCNVAEIEFYGSDYAVAAVPAAPAGLSAVSSNAYISLSWNVVSNAVGYNVKRSLTGGGPYALVGSRIGTTMVDAGLVNGASCHYVVSAVGAGGESTNSAEVSAVPSSAVFPEEFIISGHALSGGTNLILTASNSVPGHLYRILDSENLSASDWQSTGAAEAGTGSNILFNLPVNGIQPHRFFKLVVERM